MHDFIVNIFGYAGGLGLAWVLAISFAQTITVRRPHTFTSAGLLMAIVTYFSGRIFVIFLKYLLANTPPVENYPFWVQGGIFIGSMVGLVIAVKYRHWFRTSTALSKRKIELLFYIVSDRKVFF